MKTRTSYSDAVHLIRLSSFLWIGYLVALAIISEAFQPPSSPSMEGPTPHIQFLYYILYGAVALVCLGMTYWRWIQKRLDNAFIPVIVVIITVIPVLINWIYFPIRPQGGAEDPILRPLPFLFIGLLLVAWQYKWRYMLLIILGIAGLNLGIIWSLSPPGTAPFWGGLVVILVQTVLFLALGFSVGFFINRIRQQQQSLEAANLNLTHYASTLEGLATSRERNRLARELHDTLAHTLSGLSVQLEAIKAYWDIDRETARTTLDRSLSTARSGLDETRRALRALRASPLDDLGLPLAVSKITQEAAQHTNLAANISVSETMPALSPDVEQCFFRVAQEAVTNAVKHASAKNLSVTLEYEQGKVTLVVADDGIGFDVDKGNYTGHFGLTGMKERARLIGGELTIKSRPIIGTTIKLVYSQEE